MNQFNADKSEHNVGRYSESNFLSNTVGGPRDLQSSRAHTHSRNPETESALPEAPLPVKHLFIQKADNNQPDVISVSMFTSHELKPLL